MSEVVGTWFTVFAAARVAEWGLAGIAVVGVALVVLRFLSANASAAQRHAVLCAALTAVLALPFLDVTLPAWKAGPELRMEPLAFDLTQVAASAMPLEELPRDNVASNARIEAAPGSPSQAPERAKASEGTAQIAMDEGAAAASPPVAAERWTLSGLAGSSTPWAWSAVGLGVWVLGFAAVLVWMLIGVAARTLHFRRGWTVVDEPDWLDDFERAKGAIPVHRSVRLRWGPLARVPVTWGVLRPVIVLPTVAKEWGPDQRRAALLHELAHVARADHLSQTLARCACAIHWFNPFVWRACTRLRDEAERACDDRAVAATQSATGYAMELVRVARLLKDHRLRLAPAVAMARTSELEARIDAILDPERSRGPATRRLTALVVVAALLATAPLAALSPRIETGKSAPAEAVVEPYEVGAAERGSQPLVGEPTDAEPGAYAPSDLEPLGNQPDNGALPVEPVLSAEPMGAARFARQEVPCIPGEGGSSSRSITETIGGRNGRYEVMWDTGQCSVEIVLEGVLFTPDESAIASIERGGEFRMEQEGLGDDRELRAEVRDGVIAFRYFVDGDDVPFDQTGRDWLSAMIPTIYRVTGLQKEQRVARLMQTGGVDAVLGEVNRIHSDHVSAGYLTILLQERDLSDGQMEGLFQVAKAQIESDHELGTLLRAAWRPGLSRAAREQFVGAAGTIESDHELGQVVRTFLDRSSEMSDVEAVLELARSIESDHELGNVLTAAWRTGMSEEARTAFVGAARSIESDHELSRVLGAYLDQGVSPPEMDALLQLVATMQSDHERGSVLSRLLSSVDGQIDNPDAFLDVASGIESDYELGGVLRRVILSAELDEPVLLRMLDVADEISSDHERGQVLRAMIAEQWPFSEAVERRLVRSAESMGDHDEDQILARLVRARSR